MASTFFIVVLVVLMDVLVEVDGRAMGKMDLIEVDDEFPLRCDDPFAPCKCINRKSTRVVW